MVVNNVAQGNMTKQRIEGVDAARGLALVAMMAIHILPGWNDDFEPTFSWLVFAGRGAALFALLAGVSLAFMSGGQYPARGTRMTAARLGLAVRAVLVTVIGLLLGYLVVYAQVILVYYGVMFLLALPLLRLRVRTLLALSAGIALTAPVLMQATRDSLADMGGVEPNFSTLAQAPGDVLGQVLLSGTYPALPWMAFVCAGLAVGRLNLAERAVQIRLVLAGAGLAVVTAVLSTLLLGPFGGREQLETAASVWSSNPEEAVSDILIWGPDPTLPTDSWWWLTTLAPYSSTPLVLLHTIGTAVAALGIVLLLSQAGILRPLAVLGKMTLTLYSLHLLLLATGMLEDQPVLCLVVQLIMVAAFAYTWQQFTSQGPLERTVSDASKWVRSRYLEHAETPAVSETPTNRVQGQPAARRTGTSGPPPPPATPPSIGGRRQALEAEGRSRRSRNRQHR
ncbi:DUF1624 domain-containing protein [Arthrobacter yangruifuii]|uniref:DUF1624 domain-containing protein n=1 Tax=Arthrobacter yangruifuii TaxID=2606616 RepID=A0A5N6ME07_9MICC|nr:heparan-alpha-glucosaminide N-acetyltransferase domain-containing protein [Arthrobacter yangruifuii]KAD3456028.1 DUF1624 domain-containing protein [Arthrobacter yangruifuii]